MLAIQFALFIDICSFFLGGGRGCYVVQQKSVFTACVYLQLCPANSSAFNIACLLTWTWYSNLVVEMAMLAPYFNLTGLIEAAVARLSLPLSFHPPSLSVSFSLSC